LAQQVAWIIGGGSGIGAAVARRLAGLGWTVAISGRRLDRLAKVAAENPGIHPYALDVTDGTVVSGALERILADHGRLDLMLFGAIAPVPMGPGRYDPEVFRRAFDTNYLGFVRTLNPVIAQMSSQKSGQIAVLASLAGYFGAPGAAPYASSKAALISLCQSMRTELKSRGIAVRLVSPGFVRTELTARRRGPMPLLMDPDDAGKRIVNGLLRSRRFEIAFPRRVALAMKSMRLLPSPLFFALMHLLLPRDRR
jgi:NAD(P)-dependent dehydrogenase (short-subunit alcohol dehydrogenase family)